MRNQNLAPTEKQYEDGWRAGANCGDADPELFFAEGNKAPGREMIRQARAICQECPVRIDCLDEAINKKEEFGIWGGLTPTERQASERKTRLARFGRESLRGTVSGKSVKR